MTMAIEWISVEYEMPIKGSDVLFVSKGRIFHGFWDTSSSISGDWYDIQNTWIVEHVTHWAFLPKLPQEENDNRLHS